MTWKSLLSVVICSKNVEESQFIVALLIFFLSKELKGKGGEQHFQGREAGQGRKEGGPLACANPQSVAVLWGEAGGAQPDPPAPRGPCGSGQGVPGQPQPWRGQEWGGGQSVSPLQAFLQAAASPTARGAPPQCWSPPLLPLPLLLYFPAPIPALSPPSLCPLNAITASGTSLHFLE